MKVIELKKLKVLNKGFVLINILIFILLFSSFLVGEGIMYGLTANKINDFVFESKIKNDIQSSAINYIAGRFSTRWLKDEYTSSGVYRFRLEEYGEHYKFYYYSTKYPEYGYYIVFDNLLSSDQDRFIIYEDGYYEVEDELDS